MHRIRRRVLFRLRYDEVCRIGQIRIGIAFRQRQVDRIVRLGETYVVRYDVDAAHLHMRIGDAAVYSRAAPEHRVEIRHDVERGIFYTYRLQRREKVGSGRDLVEWHIHDGVAEAVACLVRVRHDFDIIVFQIIGAFLAHRLDERTERGLFANRFTQATAPQFRVGICPILRGAVHVGADVDEILSDRHGKITHVFYGRADHRYNACVS